MHSWSIKTRFAIGMLFLFVGALASILHVVLSELHDRHLRSIGENVALLAATHASTLDSRLQSARQMLQIIADGVPDQAFDNSNLANAHIGLQSPALSVFDLGLYVASKDNVLLGVNLLDREMARKRLGTKTAAPDTDRIARETRQPTFSHPYASRSCNGCPAVVLVIPIFNARGEHRGFVTGAMRLGGENFLGTLNQVRIGQNGYLYLLTRERTMLMHPDPARILKTAAQPGQNRIIDKALDENFEGYGPTVNSSGKEMIVGMRFLKTTGWLLAANYPMSEAEQPFIETRNKIFLMALLAGVVVLLLVWYTTRRLLAPLSLLTDHVAHLSSSKEKRQISLQASGEIRTLEKAFNEMISDLEKQGLEQQRVDAEIRSLNANLENLVNERTAALASTNRELESVIEQLTQTQRGLVEAEKLAALGALVAGIAHELNTPIGNCVLVASTLGEQSSTLASELESGQLRRTALRDHLANLENATLILQRNLEKAAQLISSFKRTAVDRTSDVRRKFQLEETLRDTVIMMHPSLSKAHCSVETDIEANIEMDSYPGSLNQSLAALLENAMVHGYDQAGGTISLSAKRENDKVSITVHDDGTGINPENLNRVFEPFYTTRFGKGGSGLGLHIVYNIVTGMLGGKIRVISEPGKGTSFVISLPLEAPH